MANLWCPQCLEWKDDSPIFHFFVPCCEECGAKLEEEEERPGRLEVDFKEMEVIDNVVYIGGVEAFELPNEKDETERETEEEQNEESDESEDSDDSETEGEAE